AGPLQSEMLLEQSFSRSSNSPSPDIMSLQGLRVAWASETNDGRSLNSGKVKLLVGGDTLVGRRPYAKREIKFKPSHTLFLLTNRKPHAQADDYALWQRIYLIQFKLSFIDKPKANFERVRDPDLQDKLKEESSGILAWLVRGCLEWQRQGLCPPAVIEKATAEYRSEEDILGHFIDECCECELLAEIKHKELYKAYREWCEEAGHRQMSSKRFGSQMGERFKKEKRYNVTYVGVRLSNSSPTSF
ncbi:phage/plasmid primase, P4 family, partial [Gemmatimonadota bacterium]